MDHELNLIAKTPMDQKLMSLLEPEISALGYEIVRLRFMGGNTPTLQIMAERPEGGIEVQDCSKISTAVSAVLDVEDPIEGNYNLEISSPGIDRPLTRLKDFDVWQGWEARITLDEPIENRRKFQGELAGVEGAEVFINVTEGTVGLMFDWIADAKLIMNDELMRESLRQRSPQEIDETQFDEIAEDGPTH